MTWVSGAIEFNNPPELQRHFAGDITIKKVEDLVIYGKVREDSRGEPVPEAVVKVFFRLANGREEALCQCLSGEDGHYLLHLDKKRIPAGAIAIIIRAGAVNYYSQAPAGGLVSKTPNPPDSSGKSSLRQFVFGEWKRNGI